MNSPSQQSAKDSHAKLRQTPTMGTPPDRCRVSTTTGFECISARLLRSCKMQHSKLRDLQRSDCCQCNPLAAPSTKMKGIKLNLPSSRTPLIASWPWYVVAPQYIANIVEAGRRAIGSSTWHYHVSLRTMANVTACASFSVGSCQRKVLRYQCTSSSGTGGKAGGGKVDGNTTAFQTEDRLSLNQKSLSRLNSF
jgi:hypothetical protein